LNNPERFREWLAKYAVRISVENNQRFKLASTEYFQDFIHKGHRILVVRTSRKSTFMARNDHTGKKRLLEHNKKLSSICRTDIDVNNGGRRFLFLLLQSDGADDVPGRMISAYSRLP